jgi:uncharacterized membrane protein (DUF2068 family)
MGMKWQEVTELGIGLKDRVAMARQLLDVEGRLVGEKPRERAVDLLLTNVELNLIAADMNLRGAMRLLESAGLAWLLEDVEKLLNVEVSDEPTQG